MQNLVSEISEEKLECVNNLEGSYLVLAGPGTGKTTTIVYRIKNMIEKGIDPEKILCLTFSDAAAGEMKRKIEQKLNNPDISLNIYTYHGFCNEIIAENFSDFELSENYKVISPAIQRMYLKECIDEYDTKYFINKKNNPYVYLGIIKDKIEAIKNYRYSEKEYFENIEKNSDWRPLINKYNNEIVKLKDSDEKNKEKKIEKKLNEIKNIELEIEKAKEIWEYYKLYKSKIEKDNFIDFSDMINLVLEKFETSPAFLDKIANKYEYIMVDEYQDTNKSQNEIVFNLVNALKTGNIFVVGDDDQIVYSFQGANMENLECFLRKFPNTKVICLKENRRSTQSILDFARKISIYDERRLEANSEFNKYNINKTLIAKNEKIIPLEKPVYLDVFCNSKDENITIANEIRELVNSDKCPVDENGNKKLSEIAVIVTSHNLACEFAKLLEDRNIPYQRKKTKSIFEIKSFVTLFYYMQMLVNEEFYSDKLLKLLLLPPFNINALDFVKILENISKEKTIINSIKETKDWHDKEIINTFIKTYDELREYQTNENLKNVIMEIGARTGIFKYFINEEVNKLENISALKKIIDEAEDFTKNYKKITLEEFVDYLLLIQNENDEDTDIFLDSPDYTINAVQLLTYHGSKGMEFEYVYLPNLQASKWNSSSRPSLKPIIPVKMEDYKTDDERKLLRKADRIKNLYVGITRARHTLKLSYSKESKPCLWIEENKDSLNINIHDELNEAKSIDLAINSITKYKYDYNRDFSDYIKNQLKNKICSATSINDYIKCPRMFLYDRILKLSPRAGFADSVNYGSAIHGAIEYMVKDGDKKREFYPSKEDFLEKFESILKTLPFSSNKQRKIYLGRGIKELGEYYHHLTEIPLKRVFDAEHKFCLKDENIIGCIDRIEINDDGSYTIIDYKTSDPDKCIKEICLDGEHEDYFLQICLYKYCFEKLTGKKVSKLAFYFPLGCVYYELPFEVVNNYNKAIEIIKASKDKIKNMSFEPQQDENKKLIACRWCSHKDFCNMERV